MIVTTAMLTALLITFGAMALHAARRPSIRVAARVREALVIRELDRVASTPFSDLGARSGCSVSRAGLPHRRCVTVADVSPRVRRVTLVVEPLDRRVRPDTVVLDRGRLPSAPFRAR